MTVATDIGIVAFGAYVPIGRLPRRAIHAANAWFAPGLKGAASGERAVSNWDEDAVTMAVEAARDALGERPRNELGALVFASTTAPFADRQNAVIVKEALDLDDTVATADLAGSQRAGVSALYQAIATAALSGRPALCVAADKRKARPASEGEMQFGDAAAAFVVGSGDAVVARLIGRAALSVDFVDHFRATGMDTDYGWESRWVRDEGYGKLIPRAVAAALADAGLVAADVDALIVPLTARGVAASVAKATGIAPAAVRDTLDATVGEAGCAHAAVMLAAALADATPGQRIVLTGFGSGCEVLVFETTDRLAGAGPAMGVSGWIARRREETNYMRFLVHGGIVRPDLGMRAEFDQKQPLTALYRERRTVLGLVGGRCTRTGGVQFPKTEISVKPQDGSIGTQEDYGFAERRARIATHTSDALTFTLDPPAVYGLIDFEGGGRMSVEFCDMTAEPEVGQTMRMMFRIKSVDAQRGFVKYFWKAAPAFGPVLGSS